MYTKEQKQTAESYYNYCLNGFNGEFKQSLMRLLIQSNHVELKRLHEIYSFDVEQFCIKNNMEL